MFATPARTLGTLDISEDIGDSRHPCHVRTSAYLKIAQAWAVTCFTLLQGDGHKRVSGHRRQHAGTSAQAAEAMQDYVANVTGGSEVRFLPPAALC